MDRVTRGKRPVVGVTGPDEGGEAAWLFTALAVYLAGGRAERITPSAPRPRHRIDALIIGGGADVDPTLYSEAEEEPLPEGRSLHQRPLAAALAGWVIYPLVWAARKALSLSRSHDDRPRDALEQALIARAVREGLPVLGICRGMQLLNVTFGGTLHRDAGGLYVETPEIRSVLPRREIAVSRGSRLERAMGCARCRVNALHNQAVDALGSALAVSALDANGIVQAIEHASLDGIIGVQWHPEYLPQLAAQRRLFAHLVDLARRRRERRQVSHPTPVALNRHQASSSRGRTT